jgi:VanZ family protein
MLLGRLWGGRLSQRLRESEINMARQSETEARFVQTCRAVGLACVVALIVLSLLPGNERPHTGSPGQLEHIVAYFGTAVFLALGFRTITDRVATVALLVGAAAVFEMIQRLIPGRHSQLIDWFASSLGAGSGVLAVVLIEHLQQTLLPR